MTKQEYQHSHISENIFKLTRVDKTLLYGILKTILKLQGWFKSYRNITYGVGKCVCFARAWSLHREEMLLLFFFFVFFFTYQVRHKGHVSKNVNIFFLYYFNFVAKQNVPSWLKRKLAQAKLFDLGWLGSMTNSKSESSLALAQNNFEYPR